MVVLKKPIFYNAINIMNTLIIYDKGNWIFLRIDISFELLNCTYLEVDGVNWSRRKQKHKHKTLRRRSSKRPLTQNSTILPNYCQCHTYPFVLENLQKIIFNVNVDIYNVFSLGGASVQEHFKKWGCKCPVIWNFFHKTKISKLFSTKILKQRLV